MKEGLRTLVLNLRACSRQTAIDAQTEQSAITFCEMSCGNITDEIEKEYSASLGALQTADICC